MIKSSSSTSDQGCLPVSSNCVVWQGPCLDCIDLKTGDTVSSVVVNMATELCKIQDQLNLSSLDLKCLFDTCASCPAPDKKLSSVLNLLIQKVCAQDTLLGGSGSTVTPPVDSVVVASCFQTTDLNGDLVNHMTEVDYLRAIGIKVCTIFSSLTQYTTTTNNHENRISVLENTAAPTLTLPQVTPNCVLPENSPTPMDQVLDALEEQFCQLRAVVGTPTDLSQSMGKQCVNLNTSMSLSSSSTMSSIPGWKSTVSTMADSLNNMWLAICDIRSALSDIKTITGKTCNDVTIGFLASVADNGAAINLFFAGYTHLPTGFTNCTSQGSRMTISDGMGGLYVMYVDLVTQANSSTPLTIQLNTTPLTPSGTFTFTLESCVTDNTLTCSKTVVVNATGSAQSCSSPSITSVTLS